MKLSLMLGSMAIGTVIVAGIASCATAEPVSFVGVGGTGASAGKGGSSGKGGSGGNPGNGGAHQGGSSNGGSSNGGGGNAGYSNGGSSAGGSGGSSYGGSSNGGSSNGGSSGSCSLGTGDATCDSCIDSKCSAICLACENNTACVDLLNCNANCASGDTTCENNCQTKYASGLDDALALAGADGCLGTTCSTACGGGSGGGLPSGCYETGVPNCNPLTNDGCASGETCDLSANYTLECFPPPNTAKLGGACDPTNGPFCEGKLHCTESGVCGKFCCSDSECGGGSCTVLDSQTGTLGACE